MKKPIIVFCVLVLLTGCFSKESYIPNETLESFDVDMRDYEVGLHTDVYRGISPETFFSVFTEKETCIIYIGYSHCDFCRTAIPSLTRAAEDHNARIYYLDCYNEKYPLEKYFEQLKEVLYDYLNTDETGEKAIFTPHVITVVEGTIRSSIVGLGENNPIQNFDEQKLYKDYSKLIEILYSK